LAAFSRYFGAKISYEKRVVNVDEIDGREERKKREKMMNMRKSNNNWTFNLSALKVEVMAHVYGCLRLMPSDLF